MDSCDGVERELHNLTDKLKSYSGTCENGIERAVEMLMDLRHHVELADGMINPGLQIKLSEDLKIIKESVSKTAADHRDLHGSVSKVGKAIDRNLVGDYDAVSRKDVFSGPEHQKMLNEVILQHFYRHGQLDLGDALADESGLEDYKICKVPFQELNRILEALTNRFDLKPALEWAEKNREELCLRGTSVITQGNTAGKDSVKSSLEMKLHKLQFIQLLRKGNKVEAIRYARLHFPDFVIHHEREIQTLMGAVMFAGDRLENSPYKHFLDPSLWHEIADLFIKDACSLMGLSIHSPLAVAVNAGCAALPALLNIKQVMQTRKVDGVWNAKDELPIEIDLGPDSRYHSVFACPILRQQTTEQNHPVRLTCGHCISKDALQKLSNGQRLKCPYCPVEQNPNESREITF